MKRRILLVAGCVIVAGCVTTELRAVGPFAFQPQVWDAPTFAADSQMIRIDVAAFDWELDIADQPRRASEIRIDGILPGIELPAVWTVTPSNGDLYIDGGWQAFADAFWYANTYYDPVAVWGDGRTTGNAAGYFMPRGIRPDGWPTHVVIRLTRFDDRFAFDWTVHALRVPEPAAAVLMLGLCLGGFHRLRREG